MLQKLYNGYHIDCVYCAATPVTWDDVMLGEAIISCWVRPDYVLGHPVCRDCGQMLKDNAERLRQLTGDDFLHLPSRVAAMKVIACEIKLEGVSKLWRKRLLQYDIDEEWDVVHKRIDFYWNKIYKTTSVSMQCFARIIQSVESHRGDLPGFPQREFIRVLKKGEEKLPSYRAPHKSGILPLDRKMGGGGPLQPAPEYFPVIVDSQTGEPIAMFDAKQRDRWALGVSEWDDDGFVAQCDPKLVGRYGDLRYAPTVPTWYKQEVWEPPTLLAGDESKSTQDFTSYPRAPAPDFSMPET